MNSRQRVGSDALGFLLVFASFVVALVGLSVGGPIAVAVQSFVLVILTIGAVAATVWSSGLLPYLLVPTLFSVWQNVYLAPLAPGFSDLEIQFLININVLFSVALALVLTLGKTAPSSDLGPLLRPLVLSTCGVIAVGALLSAIYDNPPLAALASARNLLSPFLFLIIGILSSSIVQLHSYTRSVMWLGVAAILFGLVELVTPGFWQNLGLQELWEKKGLTNIGAGGVPRNFYASEQLEAGQFIRRMAGPFADPVNFGTFLFIVLMAAWFKRARFIQLFTLIAIVLTVSKGALLGILIATSVWVFRFRSRFEFLLSAILVALAAGYFYAFTSTSSTGSTAYHIAGFFSGFANLIPHPFGLGFGGAGVLSGLLDNADDSSLVGHESGAGVLAAQLGIVGLVAYYSMITLIARALRKVPDDRVSTLGYGLLLGFIGNAMFNEVALSPNSSAPYFVTLGLIIGAAKDRLQDTAAISRSEFTFTGGTNHRPPNET